jgi:DNA-binding response OmpR family regulator
LELELLSFLLRMDRHQVLGTDEPPRALELLQSEAVDLVIVEPSLRRHDGYRLCQEIKQLQPRIPLMIVSERTDQEEIVRSLLSSADDYVCKPFAPRLLLARVHAVLRRFQLGSSSRASGNLTVGAVSLNLHQMQAIVNGRRVTLTPRELSLLDALMANANRVLSRGQLMRVAWGDDFAGGPKTVDVCVQRVRRKLEPHLAGAVYIHSARGFGYRFEKPASPAGRTASVTRLVPRESGPRLQAAAR